MEPNLLIGDRLFVSKFSYGYSQHSFDTQNLPSNHLEASEILEFRDYAWDKFHTDESYLNRLEKKFGLNSRTNLEETTKIKLKRKIYKN